MILPMVHVGKEDVHGSLDGRSNVHSDNFSIALQYISIRTVQTLYRDSGSETQIMESGSNQRNNGKSEK